MIDYTEVIDMHSYVASYMYSVATKCEHVGIIIMFVTRTSCIANIYGLLHNYAYNIKLLLKFSKIAIAD